MLYFFNVVSKDDREALEDFGWQIIDLSNENTWLDSMLQHPELLNAR